MLQAYTPCDHSKNWHSFVANGLPYFFHAPTLSLIVDDAPLQGTTEKEKAECKLCVWGQHLALNPALLPYCSKPVDIHSIALNVIEKCNLRCTYCFAGEGNYGEDRGMSLEMAKQVLNFFTQERSDLQVIFFGGEPLLNFQLIKGVVAWCAAQQGKAFTFALTTNATLLKTEHIEFMREHNFRLKVSYDGAKMQARQRPRLLASGKSEHAGKLENAGKIADSVGSKLEKFSQALQQLRPLTLRATVTREGISELATHLIESLTSKKYKVAYARVASGQQNQQFTLEDVEALNLVLEAVVTHFLERRDFQALLRMSSIKAYITAIHRGEFRRNFCSAGLNYVSVSTRGKFYLCHRFTEDEQECVGGVEVGLDLAKLAKIQDLRSMRAEPCNSCWMRNLCAGGCFYEHKAANGQIGKIDPLFCRLQAAEITQALRVYAALVAEAPHLLES